MLIVNTDKLHQNNQKLLFGGRFENTLKTINIKVLTEKLNKYHCHFYDLFSITNDVSQIKLSL